MPPRVVDRRSSSRIKYGELDPDSIDTARGSVRLSQVRWPVGEEPYPDVPGTDTREPWVNVKLEVTEHAPPPPNQRDLLHGGAELRMKCVLCNEPYHVASEKTARDALTEAGYVFIDGHEHCGLDEKVVAVVCSNGHVVQFREEFVRRLMKRED